MSLMGSAGWHDLRSMAQEQISHNEDWIREMMVSDPDKLTDKAAIAAVNKAAGLRYFLESIEEARKISL